MYFCYVPAQRDRRTLFIKNIPNNTSEKELKQLCKEVKIIKMKILNRKDTKNKK